MSCESSCTSFLIVLQTDHKWDADVTCLRIDGALKEYKEILGQLSDNTTSVVNLERAQVRLQTAYVAAVRYASPRIADNLLIELVLQNAHSASAH